MGAPCAHIPGEGRWISRGVSPLTRIAQTRSDLSPVGRGDTARACAEALTFAIPARARRQKATNCDGHYLRRRASVRLTAG